MPLYPNPFGGLVWESDYSFDQIPEATMQAQCVVRLFAQPSNRHPTKGLRSFGDLHEQASVKTYETESGDYLLRWRHVDFVVDALGCNVCWHRDPGVPDGLVWTLVSGVVASFVSLLKGVVVIHASGVAIGQNMACFMGPKMSGKSTLAAALIIQGCDWVADDSVAVHPNADGTKVIGSAAVLALREESAVHFGFAGDRIAEDKHLVPLVDVGRQVASADARLDTLYALNRDPGTAVSSVRVLEGADRLLELLANVRSAELLPSRALPAFLDGCNSLIRHVRVMELRYPHGFDHLPAVGDFLIHHLTSAR